MPSFQNFIFENLMKLFVKRLATKKLRERGLTARRKKFDEIGRRLGKLPGNCQCEQIRIGELYAEWLSFPTSNENRVILYLHGGAYEYGSADIHRTLAAKIGEACGVKVLLPEYRLAPEYPFPAAIEDGVQVYRWLLRQGFRPADIIFAGDSAGAGLSVVTALVLRDQNEPLPAAIICLSPWVDLTSSGDSYVKNQQKDPYLTVSSVRRAARLYAGQHRLDHPLISPVFADLTGLPPMLIQSGGHEILQSDAQKLAAQARLGGVEVTMQTWDGMWHVWQISGKFLPEATKAVNQIGQFAKSIYQSQKHR
jgi:epsilon-lactone hydrolase